MGMMMAHHRIRKTLEEKKKTQIQQENPFEKMTAGDLKEYAKANGINIAGLSKKDDIKARIIESVNAKNNGADGDPPKAIGNGEAGNGVPDNTGEPAGEEKTGGDGTVGGTA